MDTVINDETALFKFATNSTHEPNTDKNVTGISIKEYLDTDAGVDTIYWLYDIEFDNAQLVLFDEFYQSRMTRLEVMDSEDGWIPNPEQHQYLMITDPPETTFKWAVVTDPLIRFCMNYKYLQNDTWTNQTGHARGVNVVDPIDIIKNLSNYRDYIPTSQQMKTIFQVEEEQNQKLDCVINHGVLHDIHRNRVITDLPACSFKRAIHRLLDNKQMWHHLYNIDTVWPYDTARMRQYYLEESVHDIIINNPDVSEIVRNMFDLDYKYLPGLNRYESLSWQDYDIYWNTVERK